MLKNYLKIMTIIDLRSWLKLRSDTQFLYFHWCLHIYISNITIYNCNVFLFQEWIVRTSSCRKSWEYRYSTYTYWSWYSYQFTGQCKLFIRCIQQQKRNWYLLVVTYQPPQRKICKSSGQQQPESTDSFTVLIIRVKESVFLFKDYPPWSLFFCLATQKYTDQFQNA